MLDSEERKSRMPDSSIVKAMTELLIKQMIDPPADWREQCKKPDFLSERLLFEEETLPFQKL